MWDRATVQCNACEEQAPGFAFRFDGAYYSDFLSDMQSYQFALCERCVEGWSSAFMGVKWRAVEGVPLSCGEDAPCPCGRRPDRNAMNAWAGELVCERCLLRGMDALKIPPSVYDYTLLTNDGGFYHCVRNHTRVTYAEHRKHIDEWLFSGDHEARIARYLAGVCSMKQECCAQATHGQVLSGIFRPEDVSCEEHLSLGIPEQGRAAWVDLSLLASPAEYVEPPTLLGRDKALDAWWRATTPDMKRVWYLQWLPYGLAHRFQADHNETSMLYVPLDAPADAAEILAAVTSRFPSARTEPFVDGTLYFFPSHNDVAVPFFRTGRLTPHPACPHACGFDGERRIWIDAVPWTPPQFTDEELEEDERRRSEELIADGFLPED